MTSIATIVLVGIVPQIIKTSVQDNKIVIEHNFPIETPQDCVRIDSMKMICDKNVAIVSLE
jgi:hypothetical protein